MLRVEILQGGCDMEIPLSSKRHTINRSVDVGKPVRNGIKVDE
jgi:hypothetical protein